MAKTKIEWATDVWNPIVGCDKVSPGCKNCYAIRDARRMAGHPNKKISTIYEGLTEIKNGAPNWTGLVKFIEDRLDRPLRWKRPRMIFLNSESDLFHEDIPDKVIADIFSIMAAASQHIFQVLTKRPKRMLKWFNLYHDGTFKHQVMIKNDVQKKYNPVKREWPLKNVWLGVSCENQETADERIPLLLQTPAAVRWISAEPLLGSIIIDNWLCDLPEDDDGAPFLGKINWVVVGGESGPNARPMKPDWARSLRDQCVSAGVPFFFKQWGAYKEAEIGMTGKPLLIYSDGHIEDATAIRMLSEENNELIYKVTKKAAGRLLDGQEWNQMPVMK